MKRLSEVLGIAVVLLLSNPGPSTAGALTVTGDAAHSGSHGARFTLSGCTGMTSVVVPDQTLNDTSQSFAACNTLSAGNVDITGSSDVSFTAGKTIALGAGFSVDAGATFRAGTDRSLSSDAFLNDDAPSGETRYVARFYIDLTGLALGTTDAFDHLVGLDSQGDAQFRLVLKGSSGGDRRLYLIARQDGGTTLSTEGSGEFVIIDGWHAIEVDWSAATGAGANNGIATLCVDDDGSRTMCETLTGIDNDEGDIASARWGAENVDADTSGSFDQDDFTSRRSGPIGL